MKKGSGDLLEGAISAFNILHLSDNGKKKGSSLGQYINYLMISKEKACDSGK
jgi:hypothetical protein